MNRLSTFHKIVSGAILLVVAFYWGITVFFELPENYLNVSRLKQSSQFEAFFYQKWAFFAPPPQVNDRLYFRVFDTVENKISEFEVLSQISQDKQNRAPFNRKEQLLDYLISNSINAIKNSMREFQDILDYQRTNQGKQRTEAENIDMQLQFIEGTPNFKTLLNYCRLVLANDHRAIDNLKVQVRITELDIPQFADRFEKKQPTEKTLVMSHLIKL